MCLFSLVQYPEKSRNLKAHCTPFLLGQSLRVVCLLSISQTCASCSSHCLFSWFLAAHIQTMLVSSVSPVRQDRYLRPRWSPSVLGCASLEKGLMSAVKSASLPTLMQLLLILYFSGLLQCFNWIQDLSLRYSDPFIIFNLVFLCGGSKC